MDSVYTVDYLINGLMIDVFPDSVGALYDYGLTSGDITRTFGALQWGYRHEMFTREELHNAAGNGPELTKLVNRGANPYGRGHIIVTLYDYLDSQAEDEEIEVRETVREHARADQVELSHFSSYTKE